MEADDAPTLPPPGQIFQRDFRAAAARAALPTPPPTHPGARVRLVQWNLERGYQLPGIIEALRRLDADVIALQEVDVGCDRSGGADVGEEIASALSMHLTFLPEFEELRSARRAPRDQGGGVHGNALLSKFDVLEAAVVEHRCVRRFGFGKLGFFRAVWGRLARSGRVAERRERRGVRGKRRARAVVGGAGRQADGEAFVIWVAPRRRRPKGSADQRRARGHAPLRVRVERAVKGGARGAGRLAAELGQRERLAERRARLEMRVEPAQRKREALRVRGDREPDARVEVRAGDVDRRRRCLGRRVAPALRQSYGSAAAAPVPLQKKPSVSQSTSWRGAAALTTAAAAAAHARSAPGGAPAPRRRQRGSFAAAHPMMVWSSRYRTPDSASTRDVADATQAAYAAWHQAPP
jgi:hypothetical protein